MIDKGNYQLPKNADDLTTIQYNQLYKQTNQITIRLSLDRAHIISFFLMRCADKTLCKHGRREVFTHNKFNNKD